jgi:hypothetical protein
MIVGGTVSGGPPPGGIWPAHRMRLMRGKTEHTAIAIILSGPGTLLCLSEFMFMKAVQYTESAVK